MKDYKTITTSIHQSWLRRHSLKLIWSAVVVLFIFDMLVALEII